MILKIKNVVKKILELLNVRNPAKGIKISPEAKAAIILEYKKQDTNVFVETGTEFGTMIQMVGDTFDTVYSIELDKKLYEDAVRLFKDDKRITLFCGDSSEEIKKVLSMLHEPALFWLDAHGTGAMTIDNPLHCPLENELKAIFVHGVEGHVILIDDARHFDMHSLSVIEKLAKAHGYTYLSKEGILRLYKK